MVSFLEGVDYVELVFIKDKRDEFWGIVDVADVVFECSPEGEVEIVAEYIEGFSGFLDGSAVEDGEGGFSVEETLDLREGFHFEGKEDGAVGDRADMEAETEAWGVVAWELVCHKR